MEHTDLNFHLLEHHQGFKAILPEDWQLEFEAQWPQMRDRAQIWVLKDHEAIIAGGLLLKDLPPDLEACRSILLPWINPGALYIGFLYVLPERRQEGLGGFWLAAAKKEKAVPFWLSIEDFFLQDFYKKHGFQLVGELQDCGGPQWIMVG